MLPVGSMVAGYRVDGVLGIGGMGVVYLAKNPTLPRHDALKVLNTEFSDEPGFRERFLREAEVAAVLDHPNIVSIYNRGETDEGRLWIAMQYVPGTDAEAALRAGSMTPWRAVRIIGEVAKALDYAHQRNVVHHDVKPANFLLSNAAGEGEHALLSDFGVARALDDGGSAINESLMATLAYAAPEVIAGGTIDGRSDLYSLGCTLFRLLTGKKPFHQASDPTEIMLAHLHQDAPALSTYLPWSTPQLDWVIAKALAKEPAHRFQSAREFAAAAAEAVRHAMPPDPRTATGPGPAPAASPTPAAPARQWTGGAYSPPPGPPPPVNPVAVAQTDRTPRRATPWAVVAAVALLALVGGVLAWQLRPSSAAEEPSTPDRAAAPHSADEDRLLDLLPVGYDDACEPVAAPDGAVARVSCGENLDPGGPSSATYTLARDAAALQDAFDDTVSASTTVICPGNVQSPGPWRRNATPDRISGTLFCGIQRDDPVVAWTDDEKLLLSTVHSGPQGPTLDQLYTWWSSHS